MAIICPIKRHLGLTTPFMEFLEPGSVFLKKHISLWQNTHLLKCNHWKNKNKIVKNAIAESTAHGVPALFLVWGSNDRLTSPIGPGWESQLHVKYCPPETLLFLPLKVENTCSTQQGSLWPAGSIFLPDTKFQRYRIHSEPVQQDQRATRAQNFWDESRTVHAQIQSEKALPMVLCYKCHGGWNYTSFCTSPLGNK